MTVYLGAFQQAELHHDWVYWRGHGVITKILTILCKSQGNVEARGGGSNPQIPSGTRHWQHEQTFGLCTTCKNGINVWWANLRQKPGMFLLQRVPVCVGGNCCKIRLDRHSGIEEFVEQVLTSRFSNCFCRHCNCSVFTETYAKCTNWTELTQKVLKKPKLLESGTAIITMTFKNCAVIWKIQLSLSDHWRNVQMTLIGYISRQTNRVS